MPNLVSFTDETARSLEAFRSICGDMSSRDAALKALRIVEVVLSIEKDGCSPCLYDAAGKSSPFTIASVFVSAAAPFRKLSEDDCRVLTFDDRSMPFMEEVRQALLRKGLLEKESATLDRAIGIATDISGKILRDMRENKKDLAQIDHRKRLTPIIIHGYDHLHCLNRVGLPSFSKKP